MQDDICPDPLLAADPIQSPLPTKEKNLGEFVYSLSDTKKPTNELPKLAQVLTKMKPSPDCRSTPISPLNRSQESGSQISENNILNPMVNKPKKSCSANLTADSQDDCQVINLSDSDSGLDRDTPRLNPFFNDVQNTEDFVSYVTFFEGGGKPS